MGNSETRFLFWDGVPNVAAGVLNNAINCKFTLSDKAEKYTPKVPVVAPVVGGPVAPAPLRIVVGAGADAGAVRLVVAPPTRVRIKEVDAAFMPLEQLMSIKLRLSPVRTDAGLLLRIHSGATLVYQEVFTGAEMGRMLTVDQRASQDGKPVPRKNLKAAESRAKGGAPVPPGTYTVSVWISALKDFFKDVKPADDPATMPAAVSCVAVRPTADPAAKAVEAARVQAKFGNKVGGNQCVVSAGKAYAKAQFVAFNIAPGTKEIKNLATGKDDKYYLGASDTKADIALRCAIMKNAIVKAKAQATIVGDADVLKIFMAPEFFFRGAEGAYPVEEIPGIMEELRKETNKPEYKDWLFIFGTAIGYLKHSDTDAAGDEHKTKHRVMVEEVEEFKLGADEWTMLKLKAELKFEKPSVCAQILLDHWYASQGGNKWGIGYVSKSGHDYGVSIKGHGKGYKAGPCTLLEPVTTEIFNVAMVQKGGTGTDPLIVYKEKVSPVDFLGKFFAKHTQFHAIDGSGRVIDIHQDTDRPILPTHGAVDVLASFLSEQTVANDGIINPSEINKSGLGGGSVFTIDGVTFGLEVCLDHSEQKLVKFYKSNAKAGDPKVQIQLIPSAGMAIGEEAICCVPNGLVFNVDGACAQSEALVNDAAGTAPMWKQLTPSKTDFEAADVHARVGPRTPITLAGPIVDATIPNQKIAFQEQVGRRAYTKASAKTDTYVWQDSLGKIAVFVPKDIPPPAVV